MQCSYDITYDMWGASLTIESVTAWFITAPKRPGGAGGGLRASGVNKTVFWCEFTYSHGVCCIRMLIVHHNKAYLLSNSSGGDGHPPHPRCVRPHYDIAHRHWAGGNGRAGIGRAGIWRVGSGRFHTRTDTRTTHKHARLATMPTRSHSRPQPHHMSRTAAPCARLRSELCSASVLLALRACVCSSTLLACVWMRGL